jgi:hypothetical protein
MRTTLLFALILFAAAAAPAADMASLAGKWNVHITIGSYENDIVCTFAQDKDTGALTGKCSSESGPADVTGNVMDNKVTWTYKTEYNGGAVTAMYDGVVSSPAKITGSISVPELAATGDFTAVPGDSQ